MKENSADEGNFLLRVRKKRSARKDVIGQKMMRRGACEPKYYHVKVRDAKIVGEEEVCDKC